MSNDIFDKIGDMWSDFRKSDFNTSRRAKSFLITLVSIIGVMLLEIAGVDFGGLSPNMLIETILLLSLGIIGGYSIEDAIRGFVAGKSLEEVLREWMREGKETKDDLMQDE